MSFIHSNTTQCFPEGTLSYTSIQINEYAVVCDTAESYTSTLQIKFGQSAWRLGVRTDISCYMPGRAGIKWTKLEKLAIRDNP
jgi:hypothetical protein